MVTRSPTLGARVRGELGCWTRPECKVERFSYEVMTPSGARGVLEAVLWKPAIRWRIERIHVLAPIRFIGLRRNEVASRVPACVAAGREPPPFFADDDRQQRHTVALRGVDYLVEAHFELTRQAGAEDTVPKFVEMFRRRVENGQVFHRPYLGCREFAAEVLPVESRGDAWFDPSTGKRILPHDSLSGESRRTLGRMLLDIEHRPDGSKVPVYFEAELDYGILVGAGANRLPTIEEAR